MSASNKKTFRSTENPALHFITLPCPAEDSSPQISPTPDAAPNAPDVPCSAAKPPDSMPSTPKGQDALQRVPGPSQAICPKKGEKRTRRFSLAVPPSLFDGLSTAAAFRRTNVNNLCVEILTRYIQENQAKISRFNTLAGDPGGGPTGETL